MCIRFATRRETWQRQACWRTGSMKRRSERGSSSSAASRTEGPTSNDEETQMNERGDRPPTKRLTKSNKDSFRTQAPGAEWALADDQLDEALRQNFPASDAVSIVQSARRS